MALRTGGVDGILKAIASDYTATVVYSSGLQVCGTFTEVIIHMDSPVYLRTSGPTSLNYQDNQLPGHGKEYHKDGFGSPTGKLKNSSVALEHLSDGDLENLGITCGRNVVLEFETGVAVTGILDHILRKDGRILIMSFSDCKVTFRNRVLFEPLWGTYDMAVGEKIVSAFSGPADPDSFGLEYDVPEEKTHKIEHSPEALRLHELYRQVCEVRENGNESEMLSAVFLEVKENYPEEWLLPLEILEIASSGNLAALKAEVLEYLLETGNKNSDLNRLIENGLEQINL